MITEIIENTYFTSFLVSLMVVGFMVVLTNAYFISAYRINESKITSLEIKMKEMKDNIAHAHVELEREDNSLDIAYIVTVSAPVEVSVNR